MFITVSWSILGNRWHKQVWSRPEYHRHQPGPVLSFCVLLCARWAMLIRVATVLWSMLGWRAMQKSSTSCWARIGDQRTPLIHRSTSAMRLWLRKHRQYSRRQQQQPVWGTHRYASDQDPNNKNIFTTAEIHFLFRVQCLCLLYTKDLLDSAFAVVKVCFLLVFSPHSKPALQKTVKLCFPAGGEKLAGLERRTAGSADGRSRLSLGRNGCVSSISQINLAFSPLSVHQFGSRVMLKGYRVFISDTLWLCARKKYQIANFPVYGCKVSFLNEAAGDLECYIPAHRFQYYDFRMLWLISNN